MAPASKKSADEKRKTAAERKRQQRQKIKNNPELLEKERQKERDRWQQRKREGKIKTINQLSRREQKAQRENWRERNQRRKEKKNLAANCTRFLDENSPPATPNGTSPGRAANDVRHSSSSSHQSQSGRRRRRRNEQRTRRELEKALKRLDIERRKKDRYRKKYYRMCMKSNQLGSPSPGKKVRETLKKGYKEIKKKLLFAEVLEKQIKVNCTNITEKEKNVLAKVMNAYFMKKYKFQHESSKLGVSPYFQRKMTRILKSGGNLNRKLKLSTCKKFQAMVEKFFDDEENSYPSPEKNSVKSSKGVTKPKRYLTDSMIKLHKKFTEKYGIKMSYKSFLRLKPFWIYTRKITDRDTCRCIKHANFEFLLQKLYMLKVVKTRTIREFMVNVCCDIYKQNCVYRKCHVCKDKTGFEENVPEETYRSRTFYFEWGTSTIQFLNKDKKFSKTKITEKKKIFTTVNELMDKVKNIFHVFFPHFYRSWKQIQTIKNIKNSLGTNEVSIYIDFSENYTLKYTEEVQAVHFGGSQRQLSLHTGAFYYVEDGKSYCQTFCSCSENTRHDPAAIWAHIKPVLEIIHYKVPHD